ncbi:hypothetical protein [Mycolicibacterium celeriflavum]|uniref:hypothetical protein n=1 Tax=Mycolicibacterium celeriflavum TaxID=1249101 RepID=UPI001042054D|nr:hypothetical protein [Mycolicibacterium celeriflavum]
MGIEDRLRKIEASQQRKNARADQHSAGNDRRAVTANRLLRDLALETLGVLKQRNHPQALEIQSASVTKRLIGGTGIRITPGRVLTLLSKAGRWGPAGSPYGILESGELVEFRPAVATFGLDSRYGGMDKHRARIQATAEKAGCIAAVAAVRTLIAYGEPPLDPEGLRNIMVFHLNESGRLVHGGLEAEDWIAKQILR